jgi:DNA-binding CsgD family transcriptional regulator
MSFWEQLKKQFGKPGGRASPVTEGEQTLGLTPRELDVFRLLLEGYTLQETANQLGVKYSTANTHMTAIYKKLGVNSRAELIIRYRDFEKENET